MTQIHKHIELSPNQRWKIKDKNNITMILYIDYKGAYNAFNRKKLFNRSHQDFPENKMEMQFLEWVYQMQTAELHDITFQPKQGVPQGGINSPLLFNFALYYLLDEFKQSFNSQITDVKRLYLPGFLKHQEYQNSLITQENTIAYADDLAFIINLTKKSYYLKRYLKSFYGSLTKISKEWGLSINYKKSGITHVRPTRKNNIRKILASIIANEEVELDIGSEKINIPIKSCYTYLGIDINEKLNAQDHIKYLKKQNQKHSIFLLFNSGGNIRLKDESKFVADDSETPP